MPGPKKIILNGDGLRAMADLAIQMQTWEKLVDRCKDKKRARDLEDAAMALDNSLLAVLEPAAAQYEDWNRKLAADG